MKAIVYHEYGPPEVLRLAEVDMPVPKAGEVLIRVRAVEATKSDVEMRRFKFAVSWFWLPLRIVIGLTKPRNPILGGYFSGEVAAVGEAVTGFEPGQRVYGATGLKFGTYAEYVVLPAHFPIATMPSRMSFEQAAAVPLGGFNALHFMQLATVKPGDKVLINGAGASIGMHAIQIAKTMGAEVTAVDSAIKEQAVRQVGADHFIDYATTPVFATGQRYDAILDMVATSSYSACLESLTSNGRYLSGNPRLSVMIRSFFTTRFTDKTVRVAFAPETRAVLNTLTAMIDAGKIHPIADRVFPMEQAVGAHQWVETEQRLGAVVIQIGGS